ncbi:rod shape-determining protein MreC [Candidatus Falkowbacteria bacterium]|nr:rod shape-determining protein MreC [Candidatus Falkowbacteria bacterium]
MGLLFFLHYIGALSLIERGTAFVFRPVQSAVYYLSNKVGGFFVDLKKIKTLKQENEYLKNDVEKLLAKQSYCAEQAEENKFLREQSDFLKKAKQSGVAAQVIGKSSDLSVNTLIINRGTNDKVNVGHAVVSEGGTFIGKIYKVSALTSVVLLINDDLSNVAAAINNKNKTIGLVVGEYGLGIKMDFIPPEEKVGEGDLVITSGLEKDVPFGLVIGTISSVVKKPESLFQQASIKSLVEFNKLRLVTIIIQEQ